MCGRYAATLPPQMMLEIFKTLNEIDILPRFNIAPTQPVVAIWQEAAGRIAHFARWGMVPGWVKDPREFPLLVNAKAETMDEKPAFRTSLKHHRCIVPASGYYEWHTGADKKKQPYYITLADDEPMALAGLYSTWVGPEGEEIDTVATITVDANADLSPIHHRMPMILRAGEIDEWLDVRNVDAKTAQRLAVPLPPGVVKFHPVSTQVNSARIDAPDLIAPVTLEKPEPPVVKRKAQLDLF